MELIPAELNDRRVFDAKCVFTDGHRGIRINSALEFDEWQHLLSGFMRVEGAIQFVIGDLLAYGAKKYDHGKYESAVKATGKRIQTLYNWSTICTKIPPEERIYDLPFTHYGEVANLPNPEDRVHLLSAATEHRWTAVRLRRELRRLLPNASNTNRYGKPIKLDGLAHAPINEQGVVFLFGLLSKQLGFSVDVVQQAFPDCIAKRKVAHRRAEEWGVVRIEFEFLSSEFKRHYHDPTHCDLIVCWEHDWLVCPIEVLSLQDWVEKNA